MKKMVIYLFLTAIVILMVTIIYRIEKNDLEKLLMISTYYTYADRENENIYIDFYISNRNHLLTSKSSYEQFYLHNSDQSKTLTLNLNKIIYHQKEVYLNETYYKYSFVFDSPLLTNDFLIEDAYLNLFLVNQTSYDFYIGSISFKDVSYYDSKLLDLKSLSGKKKKDSYLSRLDQIEIEFYQLEDIIKTISIGTEFDVNYQLNENQISIDIPYDDKLLYACPIFIEFEGGEKQLLDYFVYVKEFDSLAKSGQLIYHYALS